MTTVTMMYIIDGRTGFTSEDGICHCYASQHPEEDCLIRDLKTEVLDRNQRLEMSRTDPFLAKYGICIA